MNKIIWKTKETRGHTLMVMVGLSQPGLQGSRQLRLTLSGMQAVVKPVGADVLQMELRMGVPILSPTGVPDELDALACNTRTNVERSLLLS